MGACVSKREVVSISKDSLKVNDRMHGKSASEKNVKVLETVCFECNGSFEPGQTRVSVFGRNWHAEHYVCSKCTGLKQIEGEAYLVDDMLLCAEHYWERNADKCKACMKPILGQKVCIGGGSSFHVECYRCDACDGSLVGKEAHEYRGKMLCHEDFVQSAKEKCAVCGKGMTGSFVIAQGKKRHQKCLKCHVCSRMIEKEEEFVEFDEHIYCETHDPDKSMLNCGICDQSLLQKGYYKNLWDEVYCESCEPYVRSCYICGTEVCHKIPATVKAKSVLCKHCSEPYKALVPSDLGEVLSQMDEIGIRFGGAKVIARRQAKVPHKYGAQHTLRDDGAIVLLVRNDLPRESTLCALAHASAHAFLGESAPSEVVEPFARFAEYYFLGSLKEGGGVTPNLRFDAHYRREQMRSKDSKLRVFHKTVNQSGGSIVQVVEYIKTNQSFPSSGQLM